MCMGFHKQRRRPRAVHITRVALVMLAVCAGRASAATVVLSVESAAAVDGEINAATGSSVSYRILATVVSDDPNNSDHRGLVSVLFDLITDLGVSQPRPVLDPAFRQTFFVFVSPGTPSGDDVLELFGSQYTVDGGSDATIQADFGAGASFVIATGTLTLPPVAGTYTVSVGGTTLATVLDDVVTSPETINNAAVTSGTTLILVVTPEPTLGAQTIDLEADELQADTEVPVEDDASNEFVEQVLSGGPNDEIGTIDDPNLNIRIDHVDDGGDFIAPIAPTCGMGMGMFTLVGLTALLVCRFTSRSRGFVR